MILFTYCHAPRRYKAHGSVMSGGVTLNGSPGRPSRIFQLRPSKTNAIICIAKVARLSEDSSMVCLEDKIALICRGNSDMTSAVHAGIRM